MTNESSLLPERKDVRPALGYKFHAERVRNTGSHMEETAAFIEAQNAEIEYLYAALQGVRNRAKRAGMRNKVAQSICSEADFALQYGAQRLSCGAAAGSPTRTMGWAAG